MFLTGFEKITKVTLAVGIIVALLLCVIAVTSMISPTGVSAAGEGVAIVAKQTPTATPEIVYQGIVSLFMALSGK